MLQHVEVNLVATPGLACSMTSWLLWVDGACQAYAGSMHSKPSSRTHPVRLSAPETQAVLRRHLIKSIKQHKAPNTTGTARHSTLHRGNQTISQRWRGFNHMHHLSMPTTHTVPKFLLKGTLYPHTSWHTQTARHLSTRATEASFKLLICLLLCMCPRPASLHAKSNPLRFQV